MSWFVLTLVTVLLSLALGGSVARQRDLRRMQQTLRDRERAVRMGSDRAQLQHPVVDLTRCLGCSTCVASCPEEGVLELVHGQAMVVNGARCVGVSACERECPVGAITVTLGDLTQRDDVPALTDELEAVGSPGLFLAGEVTAHALIKTAVDQGAAVGQEVARRVAANNATPGGDIYDLLIVGAGPAGLACSMVAQQNGLRFATLDQADSLGGTVAKYPRRKLVMSMPMDMPGVGRLKKQTYEKEELMDLWESIAEEHDLPIRGGQVFESVERAAEGHFVVHTKTDRFAARYVCLAMGRRGVPRRLDVPGEASSKVAYHLIDAHSYQGRRVLVVGGGDSAVEAALALAEQPGNQVTLSYRKEAFFRVRAKNEERIQRAMAEGSMDVRFESQVRAIRPDHVELLQASPAGPTVELLPNDEVFVMIGGVAPMQTLRSAGVSFDPQHHQVAEPIGERGSGLIPALTMALSAALVTLAFALWHRDYYGTEAWYRAAHPKHDLLGSSKGLGLWFGIGSCGLIACNLVYLLRRSPKVPLRWGSLQAWMTSHVATGIGALLLALLHGTMTPGDSVGGHAFLALLALLGTGAIGRYLYAYIPRAANGRELEWSEVKARLGRLSEEWDQGHRAFREAVRQRVLPLIEASRWRGHFLSRVVALIHSRLKLRRVLRELQAEGQAQWVPPESVEETLVLAKAAHRSATMATHFEDLRALMGTWRYLHRWMAALMVALVIAHVVYAMVYGFGGRGGAA